MACSILAFQFYHLQISIYFFIRRAFANNQKTPDEYQSFFDGRALCKTFVLQSCPFDLRGLDFFVYFVVSSGVRFCSLTTPCTVVICTISLSPVGGIMRTAKMPKPWRHQVQGQEALTKAYRDGEASGLLVMATGLGKNFTAALAFERFRRSRLQLGKRSRLLFLAHQADIVDQARSMFELTLSNRMSFGSFNGLVKESRADAIFATLQSMDRALFGHERGKQRAFGRRGFDYVIVDESHHSQAQTYRRVIRHFQPRFLMGMTATPDRADLQDIRKIYGWELFSLPLEQALTKGLLTPVDYRLVTDGLEDLSVLDTPIGRLSVKRLNKTLFIPKRDREVAKIILRHMKQVRNPRVMVFCPSIRYCDRLAKRLPNAVSVHSSLPDKEQTAHLERFRSGGCNIALTIDKFNEGIDIPDANMIIFLRSTASRTVFLQQLGRGLRKVRGKKRVLVLDFVANCERLQMVNTLWRELTDIERPGAGRTQDTAVSVDIGTVKFSHIAKRILEVLDRIHEGYTKESLISQLRRLKAKLGRVPVEADIREGSKRGECASLIVFRSIFGNSSAALKAAGLKPFFVDFSDAALLQQLRDLQSKLGRPPVYKDIVEGSANRDCASPTIFRRRFVSLRKARIAARIEGDRPATTRKALISQLRQLSSELGRAPKQADINKASRQRKCASETTIYKYFVSLHDALVAAGVAAVVLDSSREGLIQQMRRLEKKLGRIPTLADFKRARKAGLCGSLYTFQKVFGGGFTNAKMAAGMKPLKADTQPKALIAQIQTLARKLGRSPVTDDIRDASKRGECASPTSFKNKFGTIKRARKIALPPRKSRGKGKSRARNK